MINNHNVTFSQNNIAHYADPKIVNLNEDHEITDQTLGYVQG